MPTSNHQRQQRRASARRASVATDDVPDAVPRPQGRGPRNHFWDPRPPGVRRHNESNEPNQRRAARLASARGRHADAVRGRRWSRINAARCNEAKSFQAPASSASWRGLVGPSRRPGRRRKRLSFAVEAGYTTRKGLSHAGLSHAAAAAAAAPSQPAPFHLLSPPSRPRELTPHPSSDIQDRWGDEWRARRPGWPQRGTES